MELNLKDLKFSFDITQTNYEIDRLQNRLLEVYLRADSKFRRAFHTNYTLDFLGYIKDKIRLSEPIHLSILGLTRSGKSYCGITLCIYAMALQGKVFTIDYICGNAMEFLEKLKTMPEEKLKNSIFLIDEEKQSIYGLGSLAKKTKLTDVQNIIAINNISTIMLTPTGWANKEASYGLRTWGRCFKTKTCRFMLYNLTEKGRGGELPIGCLYLPIFTAFLPKDYALKLEKEYLKKKQEWVDLEMRGYGDTLGIIKKKSAEQFLKDEIYLELTKKNQRLAYISQKLGSEFTVGEVREIETIVQLMLDGNL